jgi:hypothetical protein
MWYFFFSKSFTFVKKRVPLDKTFNLNFLFGREIVKMKIDLLSLLVNNLGSYSHRE